MRTAGLDDSIRNPGSPLLSEFLTLNERGKAAKLEVTQVFKNGNKRTVSCEFR